MAEEVEEELEPEPVYPQRIDAVRALVGGRVSGLVDASEVIYTDDQTPPTTAQITTKYEALKTAHNALEYARKREPEYPSTGDQLDMMYKDTKNSTTTHADAVEAVKTKWPKDNSGPV